MEQKSLLGVGYGASSGTDEEDLGISILKFDVGDLETVGGDLETACGRT